MRKLSLWILLGICMALGCKREDDGGPLHPDVARAARPEAAPKHPAKALLHDASGLGSIEYLGFDLSPETIERGSVVELTHYFKVIRPIAEDFDVFVHGELPDGSGRVFVADHAPIFGRHPVRRWKAGETWADIHKVQIPSDVPVETIELYVGLFKSEIRATVEAAPGTSDGKNRIRAGVLKLSGPAAPDDLPVASVHRAQGAIVADGKLDEEDWARAEVLGFSDSMGRGSTVRFPTKLRLLFDDTNLYVGFESVDADITERFSKRDDPIYDHETVEVFLMPNVVAPALGPYVELQASPGGVVFDAAFVARRQGMDVGFNAGQTVGTTLDGTLNTPDTDRGWTSEWTVPWTSIRGVSQAPALGAEWRMNAFRIEKYREGGETKGEYTAWSPPKVGDFHNVVRFGRMKLVE